MSKRWSIALAITVVLVIGLVVVYRNFFGAADGTIQPVVAKPTPQTTISQRIPIDGSYASFTYPTKFTKITAETITDPVVDRYSFIKRQGSPWSISIQISRLDNGVLDDDGSYHYRAVTPSRFMRLTRSIGANQTIIFSDTSDVVFNKVGYLHHGNYDASIAMSGGMVTNIDQLQADFDALIASWQWK